jgi:tRNA U34 5-methylaminomethyl-2-thiouridine-forming methyltransferase MnmC
VTIDPAAPDRDRPSAFATKASGPAPDAAADWTAVVVVTADGSRTLRSDPYGETFRSRRGAHTESRHVFVDGTGVGPRLRAGLASRVLEVGLGTATNFAWTAAASLEGRAPLHYEVWEPDPLPASAWAALGMQTVLPGAFVEDLLGARAAWGRPEPGDVLVRDFGPVRLELVVAPIAWMGAEVDGGPAPRTDPVDAVYLDPFSPAVNPDAWTPPVLRSLARRLRPGGVLATYSVAGTVRRALAAAGLAVVKVPGPPNGKRETLIARRPDPDDDPFPCGGAG